MSNQLTLRKAVCKPCVNQLNFAVHAHTENKKS